MRSINLFEIREALRYGNHHHYTLFNEIRSIENIQKAKQHPITSKVINDIRTYAESIKEKPAMQLPFERFVEFLETGKRINYERLFFESKKELHILVLAEIVEDEGRFIKSIQERLWSWCNEYSWELPAHVPLAKEEIEALEVEADEVVALFSAETSFYLAEILSLLKNKLHPLLVYKLEKEIGRRVINPYEKKNFWWEEAPMNWAAVCGGAVGCAAIYQIEDINRLAKLIHRIIGTMDSYLAGFDKDGVTTEGLSYWQYGFSFYLYFAELLKERTCGKIDLLQWDKKIEKIAIFPTYLQFPSKYIINFSDAAGDTWDGEYGILARLAQVFDIENYIFPKEVDVFKDHTSKWALMVRNIFWSLDDIDMHNTNTAIGCYYFEESQWVIDRKVDGQGKFCAFAAKGGHNDEPHNHNDLGHFILHCNGQTIFCDLGAPEYVKEFFADQRYEFLNASSKGHSVPVINENYQMAGKEYKSHVIGIQMDEATQFQLDLKSAYNIKELIQYNRTFDWKNDALQLTIIDEFKFKTESNKVEEVLMTHLNVIQVQDGELKIVGENVNTSIYFDPNAVCVIKREKYKDHFANERQANRICIHYNNVQREKTITLTIKVTYNNI